MKTFYSDINNAIRAMHCNYGIGDIKSIERYGDGRVEVIAQGYGMKPHKRIGHITGKPFGKNTVKLYGHQMTVNLI